MGFLSNVKAFKFKGVQKHTFPLNMLNAGTFQKCMSYVYLTCVQLSQRIIGTLL